MERDKPRIFGLDLMRAGAISMVLLSHCIYFFPGKGGIFYQLLVLFGYLGVEVFFVLSGYLIGNILLRLFINGFDKSTAINFMKRRWLRTLPNYYIVLLVNVILYYFIGGLPKYIYTYFLFLQNFATRIPNFFLESFSLSIEEFAYIILAIVFLLVSRIFLNIKLILPLLIGLIICVLVFRLIYNLNNPVTTLKQWNIDIRAVVIYRLDAIFVGVVFAYLSRSFSQLWKKYAVISAFGGLVSLMAMFVGIGYFQILIEDYPQFWNVCYFLFTSLSIAMFLPLLNKMQTAPRFISVPITFFSKKSYALYLVNYSLFLIPYSRFSSGNGWPSSGIFGAVIFLSGSMILALILYYSVEKPFMDYRNKHVPDAHRLP